MIDLEESHRIELDLRDMLGHVPDNIRNDTGAITQWLMVFDRWSLPDIVSLAPEIVKWRTAYARTN